LKDTTTHHCTNCRIG